MDYMDIFLSEKCGCIVSLANNEVKIVYCPIHAAAPDMFAALKAVDELPSFLLSKCGCRYCLAFKGVTAAIAKAKGE